MAISLYKRLTRNREIENTRLSFAQYLKAKVTDFTIFESLRENQHGVKLPPDPD